MNIASSTTLGSTRIRLIWLGERVIRIDEIRLAMQTLLPEPVVPAISKCGILVRSLTSAWPDASLPR